jgi:hypothetical protein
MGALNLDQDVVWMGGRLARYVGLLAVWQKTGRGVTIEWRQRTRFFLFGITLTSLHVCIISIPA